MLLLFISGLSVGTTRFINEQHDHLRTLLNQQEVRIDGVVTSVRSDQATIVASLGRFTVEFNSEEASGSGRMAIHPGDRLAVAGTFYAPRPPRNPHDFNAVSYFNSLGVRGSISNLSLVVVQHGRLHVGWRYASFSIRSYFIRHIDTRYAQSQHRALIKALVLGQRDDLDDTLTEAFRGAGISHILAISGLHVGILASLIFFLVKIPLARLSISERARTHIRVVLSLVFLWVFTVLVGATASVVRASLMTTVFLLGLGLGRTMSRFRSLGLAYFLVLFFRPSDVFMIGFHLSFSAVLFLFIGLQQWDSKPKKGRYSTVKTLVWVSFWAALGTAPWLSYHFGSVSAISLVASPFAVPLLSAVLPVIVLSILLPFSFYPAVWLSNIGLTVLVKISLVASGFSLIPSLSGPVGTIPPLLVFILCAVLMAVYGRKPFQRKALLLFYVGFSIFLALKTPSRLIISFLDVGQGDGVVVQAPSGRALVIDTGPSPRSGQSIAQHVVGEHITGPMDVVLTHRHRDHTGGLSRLVMVLGENRLKTQKIERIWHAGWVNSPNPVFTPLFEGQTISLDSSLRMYVLHPRSDGGENDDSVVLLLKYGQNTVLLTGDAEYETEKRLVAAYGPLLRSNVLKVGHHGSNTSSSKSFLEAIHPAVSVISVGQKNTFGHPSADVVARLNQTGSVVKTTAQQGALIFEFNGRPFYP